MSVPLLIDTHCHLNGYVKDGSLASVLQRSADAGVGRVITIGTCLDDWELYRGLSAAHPGIVDYTVGLHPCDVAADWETQVAGIERHWAEGLPGPKPVGLGECGLDRFHLPKDDSAAAERIFGWQLLAFRAQLAIAKKLGCPLVIHSRGAFAESVAEIDASGVDWKRVVFHCFVEDATAWAELERRGGRASWTGIITYKTADPVRAALRAAGAKRAFFETDAPFLAPVPHRGKANEPAYLRHTVEAAALQLGVPFAELAAESTRQAIEFFGLEPIR